jgi:hypothetical protein
MADDPNLPLTFYGQSYLGRPVDVSVQGESPTGGAGSSLAGVPGAAAGAAGHAPAGAPAPSPTAQGSSALTAVSDALQGLQGVHDVSKLLTSKTAKAPGSEAPNQPTQPGQTMAPATEGGSGVGAGVGVKSLYNTLTAPGSVEVGPIEIEGVTYGAGGAPLTEASVGATGAGAGTGTAATGAGATGAETAGSSVMASLGPALGAAALESLGVSLLPQPAKGGVEAAQIALNPATALMFPDAIMQLVSGKMGNFFGGPPPAMAFPSNTWSSIQSQVGKSLPPVLPMPTNATPEQRQSIQAANDLVQSLHTYTGPLPSFLEGQQSAETWGNTMSDMSKGIQGKFTELQSLYPAAYQAWLQGQPQTPQGAPSGYTSQVNEPIQAFQTAMASGDYAKANQLLSTIPDAAQVQALKTQYAPQLAQGQSMSQGFYQDVKPLDHGVAA